MLHSWQGTFGQPSTMPPFGTAAPTAVEADADEGSFAAASMTLPIPRSATAFASPCSPPAGSNPTGIGARAAPNDITTGPTTAGPTAAGSTATGSDTLLDKEQATAGWSPTGFNKVCDQLAGGTPPEPPELPLLQLAAEPAGEALLRSFLTFAADAACSGVKADMPGKSESG